MNLNLQDKRAQARRLFIEIWSHHPGRLQAMIDIVTSLSTPMADSEIEALIREIAPDFLDEVPNLIKLANLDATIRAMSARLPS
jgi:hypothetical protein